METARRIFLRGGYKGTTINSIARAVGISPPTIYLHFNGKKDPFENLDISEEEALQDAYDANRTSILQTALILFGKHGHGGVPAGVPAKESRYSKAMFYQYFKDKEELCSAVMQGTSFYLSFLSIQPETNDYDLGAAVKKTDLAYLTVFNMSRRIAFTRVIIRNSKQYPEVGSIYRKNGISYMVCYVETVLKKYTGNPQEEVNLYLAAKACVGSLFGPVVQYKIVVGVEFQYEDDEIVDMLIKIFLHGILH